MELTQERKTELIEATLAWCNERRAEKNQEPLSELPQGKKLDGYSCPCGAACGFYVGNHWYAKTKAELIPARAIGELPDLVSEFIKLFDDGHFPELVL